MRLRAAEAEKSATVPIGKTWWWSQGQERRSASAFFIHSLAWFIARCLRNPPIHFSTILFLQKKESSKGLGGAHLSVSSIHSSSSATSSNEGLSIVKFEEILEMVNQEPDKSPLELFECKVEQWRQFGFTGGGDEDEHPVSAPLRPRRSRSVHVAVSR